MARVLVFEDLRAAFDGVRARPDGKATADDVHRLRSIIGNATAIDLSSQYFNGTCIIIALSIT